MHVLLALVENSHGALEASIHARRLTAKARGERVSPRNSSDSSRSAAMRSGNCVGGEPRTPCSSGSPAKYLSTAHSMGALLLTMWIRAPEATAAVRDPVLCVDQNHVIQSHCHGGRVRAVREHAV